MIGLHAPFLREKEYFVARFILNDDLFKDHHLL